MPLGEDQSLSRYCQFDVEKVIQAVSYISRFSENKDKLGIIKLLFFADRFHIRNHFDLITLDRYFDLRCGPVASNTLDILNKNPVFIERLHEREKEYIDHTIEKIDANTIDTKEVNYDLLSRHEMSAMDSAISIFAPLPHLVDISHEYPEWSKHKVYFGLNPKGRKKVEMDDFFKNPDISQAKWIKSLLGGNDPFYKDSTYLGAALDFYKKETSLYA